MSEKYNKGLCYGPRPTSGGCGAHLQVWEYQTEVAGEACLNVRVQTWEHHQLVAEEY